MSTNILFSSSNVNKIKEVSDFFHQSEIQILAPQNFVDHSKLLVEETGKSFLENALIKANAFWDYYQHPLLAEDSGICISFLNGEPGIYSARYPFGHSFTDQERNAYILEAMKDLKSLTMRSASYHIVLVFILNSREKWIFKAIWNGFIAFQSAQQKDAFAYDDIFVPENQNPQEFKTVSAMSYHWKLKHSHRGKVLEKFRQSFLQKKHIFK